MAIAFSYTESTNTVVVTGGTEGTPATMADFVAADRSNSASLLAAITAIAGVVLTYPVRPVEQKALRLDIATAANGGAAASGDESIDIYGTNNHWTTFSADEASGQTVLSVTDASYFRVGDVVRLIDISAPATTETATISAIDLTVGANTITVGATSNAYVSGDIVGINQTETIDTSGGHGAFVTVFSFGQIAYIDCNGYDGTNTVAVDQPIWGVIWNNGNKQYRVDVLLDIGNSVISTFFLSYYGEMVSFDVSGVRVRPNATLTLGQIAGDYGVRGAFWYFGVIPGFGIGAGGTVNLYGSTLFWSGNSSHTMQFSATSTLTAQNSVITGGSGARLYFLSGLDFTFKNVTVINFSYWFCYTGGDIDGLKILYVQVLYGKSGTYFWRNITLVGISLFRMGTNWNNLVYINPTSNLSTPDLVRVNGYIAEMYDVEFTVVDKAGAVIQDVLVSVADDQGYNVTTKEAGATLMAAFNYVATTVSVSDGTQFATGNYIRIGCDFIYIESIAANVLTVARATADYGSGVYYFAADHNYSSGTIGGQPIYDVVSSIATDASGIASFVLPNKFWNDARVEYNRNPYVFTFSKAGYETLTIPNITIDKKIDWVIKLKPKVRFDLKGNPYAMIGDKNVMELC